MAPWTLVRAQGRSNALPAPLLPQSPLPHKEDVAVKSIAKSEAHPSPQALITHYPLTQMHHWFTMAQWPVRRMKAYLEACEGPTPVAEALRQMYLDRRFSRREIDSHSSRYASTFLQKYGHFCEVIFRPIGPIATPLLRGHHLIIASRAGQSCPAGVCNGSPQWPGATEKIPHNVASESQ